MRELAVILAFASLFIFFKPVYGKSFIPSLSCVDSIAPPEVYIDPRDNEKYEFVSVANQNWMTSNLRYETPRRCNGLKTCCKGKNGNYYTIEGAFEAIPPGWRLPTKEDYELLFKNYGVDFDSLEIYVLYEFWFVKLGDPINLYSKNFFYHKDINFWMLGDLRTQYFWTSTPRYGPFNAVFGYRSGIQWYQFGYNCVDEILGMACTGHEDEFLKVRCVRDL
jgi:uncharacterized protein (TIGR02145 family)